MSRMKSLLVLLPRYFKVIGFFLAPDLLLRGLLCYLDGLAPPGYVRKHRASFFSASLNQEW